MADFSTSDAFAGSVMEPIREALSNARRWVAGGVADAIRLLIDGAWLNLRKTHYRWYGGRCPCQCPSDSGRGHETQCEVAGCYHNPIRLRFVCPLLEIRDGSARCSVDSTQVRPFWSRVILVGTLAIVTTYGLGVGAVYSLLRYRGLDRLGWSDVAWPPRWPTIAALQSDRYFELMRSSIRRGDFATAGLALSSAFLNDPENFSAGLALMHLREQSRQFAATDQLYRAMLQRFPDHQTRITLTYHDCLMASSRLNTLVDLAWEQIRLGREENTAWLQPLLLGLRLSRGEQEFVDSNWAEIVQLPSPLRDFLLEWHPSPDVDPATVAPRLTALELNDPLLARMRVERFIEWQAPLEAWEVLEKDRELMGKFEHQLGLYALSYGSPDQAHTNASFVALISRPLTPAMVERIGSRLILYPDATAVRNFLMAPLTEPSNPSVQVALWIVAELSGHPADAAHQSARFRDATGLTTPIPLRIEAATLPQLLSGYGVPRELTYALRLKLARDETPSKQW